MDELSKKRLQILGYELYKRCSEGEVVSDKELKQRFNKIRAKYPTLTLDKLISECKFKETSDKFKETPTYSCKVMDKIADQNIFSKDVLEHVLHGYLGYDNTVTYYPDGKIHQEFQHVGKTKMGKYKEYFPNGKLAYDLNYVDGKLDGESKIYTTEGSLLLHDFYKNGKLEGPSKAFSSDGKLIKSSNYKNGKLDGLETSYVTFLYFLGDTVRDYPVEEIFYKDGRKIWSKTYHSEGRLRDHIIYNRFRPNTIKAWKRDGTPITNPRSEEY
jgi:antitoxin component YwqK of YwqJK toxin-antitoxin module